MQALLRVAQLPEGRLEEREKLEQAGISLRLVAYDKVYLGGGGIHCSTGPLVRDAL